MGAIGGVRLREDAGLQQTRNIRINESLRNSIIGKRLSRGETIRRELCNFCGVLGFWNLIEGKPLKSPWKVSDGIVNVYISEPSTNLRHSML